MSVSICFEDFQGKMLGAPDEVALAIMAVYRFFRGSGSIQIIG